MQMNGVGTTLATPDVFEKLAQQAPAEVHLVLVVQPIVRSAMVSSAKNLLFRSSIP
jgi:hypothetical protein